MLDINLIRKDPNFVSRALAKRGLTVELEELLRLDEKKRKQQTLVEEKKAERNRVSSEVAALKRSGADIESRIKAMQKLGEKIAKEDAKVMELEAEIFGMIANLPNLPLEDVQPGGKTENKVIKSWGTKPTFDFKPKDHVELCTAHNLIDYERAAKISGSGTWIYTGDGARIEWALLNYFVDFHTKNNYTFIMPPHILNYESGFAAGQFPKFQDEVFVLSTGKDKNDKSNKNFKFIIPTSETAILNLHRGETIPEDKLPIKYFGYSPCYRTEGGGYGSTERGMIRGHQFNKIEMFIFCAPQDSKKYHEELTRNAELLVEGLGLHYQTVALAAGDVGAAMAKTMDVELYIPSMNGFKECSSVSNAWDYQARRANIKMKTQAGSEYLHTLNASGLATSRLLPAIVEQFQRADGTFELPEVLKKYMGK